MNMSRYVNMYTVIYSQKKGGWSMEVATHILFT